MLAQIDVTPWLDAGWSVALLVLVLSAIGIGLRWFLKAYLEQQEKEFEARQQERMRNQLLITEQQEFIKGLAQNAIADLQKAIETQSKTAQALEEIVAMLLSMNKQISRTMEQLTQIENGQTDLSTEHLSITTHIRELDRTIMTRR